MDRPVRPGRLVRQEGGKDGANGISPSASSVAQALNDAVFRNKLAEVLFQHYGSQLTWAGRADRPGRQRWKKRTGRRRSCRISGKGSR